jgi:hypothetical protein
MRETIKEWKDEWIETNGHTDDLEVVIIDSKLNNLNPYIYEGCFAEIPRELEEKRVVGSGKILDSSVYDRIGVYSLRI